MAADVKTDRCRAARFDLAIDIEKFSFGEVFQEIFAGREFDVFKRVRFSSKGFDLFDRFDKKSNSFRRRSKGQHAWDGHLLVERHSRKLSAVHPRDLNSSTVGRRNIAERLGRVIVEARLGDG